MPDQSTHHSGVLSPDDAFQAIGNEVRIQILNGLGLASEPLSFSDLYDRVPIHDSGLFSYHLNLLQDHFIRQTDDGYRLEETGRRVVEAISSGVLTERPARERLPTEHACTECAAPVDIRLKPGAVEFYCTACAGIYGEVSTAGVSKPAASGYLGQLSVPPAGFQNRTPNEISRAARLWGGIESLYLSKRICPRCSAELVYEVDVCENHDTAHGVCDSCQNLDQVMYYLACTNCIFESGGHGGFIIQAHPDVLAVSIANGLDPIEDDAHAADLTWDIRSTDPFDARCTYSLDEDELVLEIDEHLHIRTVRSTLP